VAVRLDHQFISKFLLEHGANLDVPNADGETVLHVACQKGNIDILKLILSHAKKSLYTRRDNEGRTALHLAAIAQRDDVVKLLTNTCPFIIPIPETAEKRLYFICNRGSAVQ